MAVLDLSAATVLPFEARRRAPERRAPRDAPSREEPPLVAEIPPPPAATPEESFYATLFRADLSSLTPHEPAQEGDWFAHTAPEFFVHLGALIVAVRDGDLARARAEAEALETEALVDRSHAAALPLRHPNAESRRVDALSRLSALEPSPTYADAVYQTLAHELSADGAA